MIEKGEEGGGKRQEQNQTLLLFIPHNAGSEALNVVRCSDRKIPPTPHAPHAAPISPDIQSHPLPRQRIP